jgi:hypothetical protein
LVSADVRTVEPTAHIAPIVRPGGKPAGFYAMTHSRQNSPKISSRAAAIVQRPDIGQASAMGASGMPCGADLRTRAAVALDIPSREPHSTGIVRRQGQQDE